MKVCIFTIAFLCSNIIYAEPAINIAFDHYYIFPISEKTLFQEIDSKSPIYINGKVYRGQTDWLVNWSFRWKTKNGGCKISTVTTSLDAKYTMPKISEKHSVSQNLQTRFDQFYKSLFKHEKGHMESGLYAAREIESSLRNLGQFNDCKILNQTANSVAEKIIQKYNKRDIEYDRITDHGAIDINDSNNFIYP